MLTRTALGLNGKKGERANELGDRERRLIASVEILVKAQLCRPGVQVLVGLAPVWPNLCFAHGRTRTDGPTRVGRGAKVDPNPTPGVGAAKVEALRLSGVAA